jgi:predicted RNA-binding protein with PUA-like domain
MPHRYWLVKSEPDVFSIQHLARAPRRTAFWDGVRNYQARNFLREMQVGDGVLFYHSNADPPGVAGTARVAKTAAPDPTQFDPASEYHDPKSTPDAPRWYGVEIELDRVFDRLLPLEELRGVAGLEGMVLLRKGSRLSVQPVSAGQWRLVTALAARGREPAARSLRTSGASRTSR